MNLIKRNLLEIVFYIGLFMLPLIFWPWADIPFEIPKVWFVCRWIEILLLVGVVTRFTSLYEKRIDKNIVLILTVFLSVIFLSSVLGIDFEKSLLGNYFREDGIITFVHLLGFCFFIAFFFEDKWKNKTILSIVLGSLSVSIFTNYLGIQIYIIGDDAYNLWNGAVGATFGQPNYLAGYLLVTFPFTYWKWKENRYFKWLLALISQVFAILLTLSWAAAMGIFIFLIAKILLEQKLKKKLWFFTLLSLSLVTVIGLYFYSNQSDQFVAESRTRIVHKLLISISNRPILGWGWTNVDYAFKDAIWPVKFDHDVYLDKAHSHILEVATTTGISGLSIYLYLLYYVSRKLYRQIKVESQTEWYKLLMLVWILVLFHSQTNVVSIAQDTIFWLIVGYSAKSNFKLPPKFES